MTFVAVVAVTSCGVDADDDAGAPSTEPIASVVDLPQLDGGWSVDDLTVNGERIELDAAWPVTLTIEGEAISGIAACNRFIGSIDASSAAGGGSFVVSDLSWTEMGCDQSAMEIEQSFLTALQVVDSYEAADGLYVTARGVGTGFHLVRADRGATLQPNDDTDVNGANVSMPSPTEDLDPGGGDLDGGGGYLSTDTLASFTDDQDVLERARLGAEGPYYEVAVLQSV